MTLIPTGAPAWTRTAEHTQYGGSLTKKNYMGIGAVNPLTDVDAADFCRMTADLTALARVSPMWVLTYQCHDGADGPARAPTIEYVAGMTGVRLVSYEGDEAPRGFPSAARNGNGDVTFTFEAEYSDEYGVSGAWAPTHIDTGFRGTTAGVINTVASGSTVRARAFDHTGAAVSDAGGTLEIF